MVQPNYAYRAVSTNPAERKAVEDAFAKSILWGFTAIAETSGRVLVDLTRLHHARHARRRRQPRRRLPVRPHAKRRLHGEHEGVSEELRDRRHDDVHLRRRRRRAAAPGPGQIGGRIGDVTPTAEAVTLRLHHSFIELPDANYKSRAFDARSGFGGYDYIDYGAPLGERHAQAVHPPPSAREEGSVGGDERSRQAHHLLRRSRHARADSDRRSSKARAGGIRRSRPPASATASRSSDARRRRSDGRPLQHHHLGAPSTRGWSYGSSISDPRTGEIIKGHVTLGSIACGRTT